MAAQKYRSHVTHFSFFLGPYFPRPNEFYTTAYQRKKKDWIIHVIMPNKAKRSLMT
jgi:hypothetical protein